jgi:aminoglycoside phosphotransferase (APT) family kinase protein
MAQVFAVGHDAVVKLDRPEFNGVAASEAAILRELARSGLPVPEVIDTVVIDGRHGLVMQRLDGPLLSDLIRAGTDVGDLAEGFVELHVSLHAAAAPSAPNLLERLGAEIERSDLPVATRTELLRYVDQDAGEGGLCHLDFHPHNVIVTDSGWKVIDWLGAACGPPVADFARSLLLRADATDHHTVEFMKHVRARGMMRRGLGEDELHVWTRIVAAARLSEGVTGDDRLRLTAVALGSL